MSNDRQKLELTWIGKNNPEYDIANIEPRILEERNDLSYGDPDTENIIIHGDNLLALKALLPEYEGRIKCIYIDPPYNTDNAFENYDDSVEHSTWLSLMKPRLQILKMLLKEDGSLIIQIDDNEYARLYLLLIEIFEEQNLKTICVKMSEATGVKMAHVINKGRIPKLKEYLIVARNDGIKDLFVEKIPKEKWDNEYKHVVRGVTKGDVNELKSIIEDDEQCSLEDIARADKICSKMHLDSLGSLFSEFNAGTDEEKQNLKYENAWRIVRDVATSDTAKKEADTKRKTFAGNFFVVVTPQKKKYVIKKDYNPSTSQPRIKLLFADDYLTIHPGDFWQDIKTTGLDNEGGVDFRKGKKPEALLKRIIGMSSNEGEWVLDSFLGSGTTCAVAQKMNRKYIGIEMGDQAYTHCKIRLEKVTDGMDQGGISKAVGWTGGGGFKFYELAPSFVTIDEFGNPVIDSHYSGTKLIRASVLLRKYCYFPGPCLASSSRLDWVKKYNS